jgi:4-hydroxyphenylpyruvate dioxygenase
MPANPGQIEEYLQEYKGEGIQHVAMGSTDLYKSIETLIERASISCPPPTTSTTAASTSACPSTGAARRGCRADGILIDGEGVVEGGYTKVLLQRFSKTVIGPIFFEFIQRKGDDGFGEGNFKALFESIEEDQIRRGVLKAGSSSARCTTRCSTSAPAPPMAASPAGRYPPIR